MSCENESKTCFKCGKEKSRSEFYSHPSMADGLLGKCKECAKLDVTQNRDKNGDYYRNYDKLRLLNPNRRAQKAESLIRFREKYPEKCRAHNIVAKAIAKGDLIRKNSCEKCGKIVDWSINDKLHAHHEDYSKPLDIIWLCPRCHNGKD